jgi:hypothetical protein
MRFTGLLIFALAACTLGHNWLEMPLTRSGSPDVGNTNSPCDVGAPGAGGYNPGQSGLVYTAGTSIAIQFTQNHAGNDHNVRIASYSWNGATDTGLVVGGDFLMQTTFTAAGTNQLENHQVTCPSTLGMATMWWEWSGYMNCVDFLIIAQIPDDAESTDVDLNGDPVDGNYVYLTADGHGIFDAETGVLTCEDGWIEFYNEDTGNLAGCMSIDLGDGVIYVTIHLNFGTDTLDLAEGDGWSEENFVQTLADILNYPVDQIEITYLDMGATYSTMTLAFYDGEDGTALELYTEFSSQYRDDESQLNADALTAWIDTTAALETSDSDPYDDGAASTVAVGAAAVAAVAGALCL